MNKNIMKKSILQNLGQYVLPYAAIDLGTVNTLISLKGRGVVLNEPSVIAVSVKNEREVLAVGYEALSAINKEPGKVRILYPMRDGVVADKMTCETMLRMYLQSVLGKGAIIGMQLMLCLPLCVSAVERRALQEAARGAGVREAKVMEEPLAAALGAHLPVYEATGSMIVDIGGGTTDIAVISLGGIAAAASVRTAGIHIDNAIIEYAQKEYGLLIGSRTAEQIKRGIGTLSMDKGQSIEVRGRNKESGLPMTATLCGGEIAAAIMPAVRVILDAIRKVLRETPPELAGDVMQHGITLCGGGAQLRGLDRILCAETGIPVYMAENPMHCVAMGALRAMCIAERLMRERINYGSVELKLNEYA